MPISGEKFKSVVESLEPFGEDFPKNYRKSLMNMQSAQVR